MDDAGQDGDGQQKESPDRSKTYNSDHNDGEVHVSKYNIDEDI